MQVAATDCRRYDFTLVLEGESELTEDTADAIYGACDDSTLLTRDGVNLLMFTRESESFEDAIRSAIADVSRATPSLHTVRVEPDDLVPGAGEPAAVEDARAIGAINAALELRRRVPEFADAVELLRSPGVYGTVPGAAPAPGKGATPSL